MIERSDDEQTTSRVVHTGFGYYTGCRVFTDGTNDATLILYDALAASGLIIDKIVVKGDQLMGGVEKAKGPGRSGFPFHTGMYASISGTGASYLLHLASIPPT